MAFWDRFRRRQAAPGGAKLTSPDGLPVVHFPPEYIADLRLYGLRGTYGHMYRTQPNVRSVVKFLARAAASVELQLIQRVPTSPTLPNGRLRLEDHPMIKMLDRPYPVTRTRLWESTVSDIAIYDVAYWQKIRLRPGGSVKAVVRVPPAALIPDRDPVTQRILRYKINATDPNTGQPAGTPIELDNLVVFQGYDPEATEGQVSPLETLRRVLAEEWAAGRNREFMWRNSTRKSGIVERPLAAPPWKFEAREAWRADFESVMSGETNAGRVALLEDGMQWKDDQWSPEEMQYLEARKLTRLECAAGFGVDPRLVFATDQPADKDARTGFYVDRLVPMLKGLQEEIDIQLLPDFEPLDQGASMFCWFDVDEKLRGSPVEQMQVASAAVGGPFITVNEMRANFNLPPVKGGDQIFVPLNSIRGGGPQGSPQAPTQTPGPGTAPGETPGEGTQQQASWDLYRFNAVEQTFERIPPAELPARFRDPFDGREPEIHVHVHIGDEEIKAAGGGGGDGQPPKKTAAAAGGKGAPPVALRRRDETADKYKAVIKKHFDRQARTVKSTLGRSKDRGAKVALDSERWNKELAEDLRKLTEDVVDENARRAIAQLTKKSRKSDLHPAVYVIQMPDGRIIRTPEKDRADELQAVGGVLVRVEYKAFKAYDPERTRAIIDLKTQSIASFVNEKTMADVDEALDEEDSGEALDQVFDETADFRAGALGLGLATQFINFGREEGGKQAEATAKVWTVTSSNSRHPEMSGDRADIGGEFSNGLKYPGDFSGDPAEAFGCHCLMALE